MSRRAFEKTVERVVKQTEKDGGKGPNEEQARRLVAPIAERGERKAKQMGSDYYPKAETSRQAGEAAIERGELPAYVPKPSVKKVRIKPEDAPSTLPLIHQLSKQTGVDTAESVSLASRSTMKTRISAGGELQRRMDRLKERLGG